MKCNLGMPYLSCGKVCNDGYFKNLSKNHEPIDLACVKVSLRNIENPHVLINYSQNLEFEFGGVNPKLSIEYRLIRKSNCCGCVEILEHWNYKVEEIIPTTVENLNSIEPLIVNYCDCLDNYYEECYTYILQISKVVTENTSFNISNQEISAIVSSGSCS